LAQKVESGNRIYYKHLNLLGCYAVSTGRQFLIFWRNTVPLPSWSSTLLGLLHPDDGGIMLLHSVRNNLPADAAQHPRRLELSSALLLEPKISYNILHSKEEMQLCSKTKTLFSVFYHNINHTWDRK
jgi:hypothetical protein